MCRLLTLYQAYVVMGSSCMTTCLWPSRRPTIFKLTAEQLRFYDDMQSIPTVMIQSSGTDPRILGSRTAWQGPNRHA
jgi:hypothetical protein